jgi:hypothetical protein
MYKAMRVNMKLPWRPSDVRGDQNVDCLLLEVKAETRAFPETWPCVQQAARLYG